MSGADFEAIISREFGPILWYELNFGEPYSMLDPQGEVAKLAIKTAVEFSDCNDAWMDAIERDEQVGASDLSDEVIVTVEALHLAKWKADCFDNLYKQMSAQLKVYPPNSELKTAIGLVMNTVTAPMFGEILDELSIDPHAHAIKKKYIIELGEAYLADRDLNFSVI